MRTERGDGSAPGCRRVGRPIALALRLVACAALPALLMGRAPSAARAAGPGTVTLRDGSTISGEVVSVNAGVYSIKSAALGTIYVKEADVRSVVYDVPPPAPAAPAPAAASEAPAPGPPLDALQERMTGDPDTMNAIAALRDDPEVSAIFDDPEVMSALQSGNVEALLSNPKMTRFADDPRVQDITKKLGR